MVAGVNVKLAKVGGVGPAKRMLERARAMGFRTFLGCMEETSIGIAASAAVSPLADWVDLDGCLLLADDPVSGLDLSPMAVMIALVILEMLLIPPLNALTGSPF